MGIVTKRRTEKVEGHRTIRQHSEFALKRQRGAFIGACRQNTDGGSFGARADVVRARAARLHPLAVATPNLTVVRRPDGDRARHARLVDSRVAEDSWLPVPITGEPLANSLQNALSRDVRNAEA